MGGLRDLTDSGASCRGGPGLRSESRLDFRRDDFDRQPSEWALRRAFATGSLAVTE